MNRRFVVGTSTGFLTDGRTGGKTRIDGGLSAYVFDSLHQYKVYATFRSEEQLLSNNLLGQIAGKPDHDLARRLAIEKAETLAAQLNAEEET